jgi:hypothetical protein
VFDHAFNFDGSKLELFTMAMFLLLFFMDNRHAFATLSFIAETFLFLYVGMDALDIEKWKIVGQTYRYVLSPSPPPPPSLHPIVQN